MTGAVAWLPRGASTDSTIRRLLGEVLNSWSARWFASERVVVAGLEAVAGAATDNGIKSHDLRPGMALRTEGALHALVVQAVHKPAKAPTTATDRAVLEHLGRAMLADLGEMLERGLNIEGFARGLGDDTPFADGTLIVSLGVRGRAPLGELLIALPALVALRKKECVPAPERAPLHETLAGALTGRSLTLGAVLGRASVSLGSVLDLTVGDVVMLDTRIDQPIDLTVAGGVGLKAKVFAADGGMSLHVHA